MVADTLSTMPTAESRDGAGLTSAPQLVLALECDRPLAPKWRHSLAEIDVVKIGRGDELRARSIEGGARVLTIRLPDAALSRDHARILRARGRWLVEDAGSKNGTRLDGEKVARGALRDGRTLQVGHTLFLFRDGVPLAAPDVPDLVEPAVDPPELATFSARLAAIHDAVARVAPTSLPIMIAGASGTGKEILARAAHALSGRSGAFVAVNCGAIPANLIESTLFGHRRGAFSGAVDDRPGVVRSADRGTLFLDEIGDLPPTSQTAFLRVLQEQEVVPVGDARPVRVDVRVVTATHRPLARMVDRGEFRADLFARLSGLPVELPGLSERREDLGLIIATLLRRAGAQGRRVTLRPDAAYALLSRSWPLNVRELERCLATAHALARDRPIELSHLSPPPPQGGAARDEDASLRAELVGELERQHGNVAAVARAMGKGRMQIHRWLKRFGLSLNDYRRR